MADSSFCISTTDSEYKANKHQENGQQMVSLSYMYMLCLWHIFYSDIYDDKQKKLYYINWNKGQQW